MDDYSYYKSQFPIYIMMKSKMDKCNVDGLVLESHNSSAIAMELHLSCTNPSMCNLHNFGQNVAIFFILFLMIGA